MDLNQYQIIPGQFITLKVVTKNDAPDIYRWRTSASGFHLNQPEGYSLERQIDWIEKRPTNELNYIIYSAALEEKVGMISIVDIDEQNRKAEVGRLLLHEKYLHESNPYGLEALKITYDIVLNKWNFNKIYGTILSSNVRMIQLQKFLGMQEEGILRKHLFLNNEFLDLHLFCIFTSSLNSHFIPKINFLLKAFKGSFKKELANYVV